MKRLSGRRRPLRALCGLGLLAGLTTSWTGQARAQIALATAINLALKSSPKVKLAQVDVTHAQAALAESKAAFIPALGASGGVGKSTGAPLAPPVVFSIAAQSLVFNSSQIDYIRAARASVASAQAALDAVRSDVVEDVASTYVALANARDRQTVQDQALADARQLVTITSDRFTGGIDPHIEVIKSRHTEAQIRLQQLQLEDEIALAADHLARLTGLVARGLQTDRATVPALRPPGPITATETLADDRPGDGMSAAFTAAEAKQYIAHGERRYLLRPQVAFNASYSRISTAFTTYTQYYPGFGAANNSFNSLNLGVEITVPILDMVHRAKAKEAAADAAHSLLEAQLQQLTFLEGRFKLRHSAEELAARRDLAQLDQELAQDQLEAVLIRLQTTAGATQGPQLTPKDEKNARLQERLRTLDTLTAELQLQQAEISLLRQEGTLSSWLADALPAAAAGALPSAGTLQTAPADAGAAPNPPLPATVGTEPAAATPPSAAPPVTPTTGSPPATLPAGPVTSPGTNTTPATPPATPPVTPHP